MAKVKLGKFTVDKRDLEKEHLDAAATGDSTMENEPRATAVRYDSRKKRIIVELSNDSTFIFPPKLAQGLAEATESELADVAILGVGFALDWPQLDAQFSVSGLIAGVFGTRRWMHDLQRHLAQAGRRGGSSRSAAKSRASVENGKKGGRPMRIA